MTTTPSTVDALITRLRLQADRISDPDHPDGWLEGDDETVALLRDAADQLETRR